MRLVLGLLLAAATYGCGSFGAPAPTPGGFSDVVAALVQRGVTIHEHVSGDDGCGRVELHDNAARLTVSTTDDATRRDIYLFRWRRATDFDGAVQSFLMCVGDFRSTRPGAVVAVVEQRPWRAFGADWPGTLEQGVRDALREAGGT